MRRGLIIFCTCLLLFSQKAYAAEPKENMITKRATAYCLPGRTYTGKEVRKGICASGDKSLVGKLVAVYQRLPDNSVGKLIDIYECEDTGCSKYVIDVWCPDLDSCHDYMKLVYEDDCKGKIWIEVIDRETVTTPFDIFKEDYFSTWRLLND